MPAGKLKKIATVAGYEALKPDATVREYADAKVRGLFLKTMPSGVKTWLLRYRYGGKNQKLTIGPFGGVTLADARAEAQKALGKLAGGVNPAAEKAAVKAAQREAPGRRDGLVRDIVEAYLERRVRPTMRTAYEVERLLRKEIVAVWGARKLDSISKADMHQLVDDVALRAPVLADRVRANFKRLCAWAVDRDLIAKLPPAAEIRPTGAEQARDRILSDDELRDVWNGVEAFGYPYAPVVRLLVLTGARRAEIAELRWSEIDLAGKAINLPKERVKNGVPHQIHLSAPALRILEGLPRREGCPFVFSTDGRVPVRGFSKPKRQLDAKLPDGMPPFVLHDARRTFVSNLARLGINLPVIERCINHVSGSFAGVTGTYQRFDFGAERQAAFELYGAFIARLIAPEPGANVVGLRRLS